MKFFNREKEVKEILSVIEDEPQFINFVYGPINSGKTTLINEVITNRLNKDKYQVFYINLRGRFIENYRSFIKVLFSIKRENLKGKILGTLKNIFFSIPKALSKEAIKKASHGILEGIPISESLLEKFLKKDKLEDIFVFLEDYFENIKNSGKIPILIIDELQVIGDLKINGLLIYKLFNFFIHLTKEKHLAHVFCISSDSLFIEKVYNEGKLKNRADYILVDDFEKEEAISFLKLLEKEILKGRKVLSSEDKGKIYELAGGKPILLIKVIEKLKTKTLNEVLSYFLKDEKEKIISFLEKFEYIDVKVNYEGEKVKIDKNDVLKALKLIAKKEIVKKNLIKAPIYYYLTFENILFLNPMEGILKPQSRLTWHGIKQALKEINFGG